jgi:hypothetical protein
MELSPTWTAVNCTATQELSNILSNPNVHWRDDKSPPHVSVLKQTNRVYTIPSISPRSNLILSPTYVFIFLVVSFLLTTCDPLRHSCYIPWPSHTPWLDRSNYTWRRVQVMKLVIMLIQQSIISWTVALSHHITRYIHLYISTGTK